MDYPKWAPAALVKLHMDHTEAIRLGPRETRPDNEETLTYRDPNEPDICPDCGLLTCRCEHNGALANSLWPEMMRYEFDKTERSEGILRRMLTHMDMEGFYAWMSKARVRPTKGDWLEREQADGGLHFSLYWEFSRRARSFDALPNRTAGEKKKAMERIAKAAEDLHRAILEDDDAAQIARDAIPAILNFRCRRYQVKEMEQESPIVEINGYGIDELEASEVRRGCYGIGDDGHLSIDLDERLFGFNIEDAFPRYEFDPNDPDDPGKCQSWDKQPLEQRLAWWHREARDISAFDVLHVLADEARAIGDTPDSIKQRRQDGGWRPFVIRTINGILGEWFEQVPPSRVAQVASAILDVALTREDVKPYLK